MGLKAKERFTKDTGLNPYTDRSEWQRWLEAKAEISVAVRDEVVALAMGRKRGKNERIVELMGGAVV